MGAPTSEYVLDGLSQAKRVHALVFPNEQKIDEISSPRRSAALVRPRVGVWLLSDMPLQRHQRDLYWCESEVGQKPRAPRRLSIPGVWCDQTHVDLQWLEQPSGNGALEPVPHRQLDSAATEILGPDHRETEMVADLGDRRALEICSGGIGALAMVRIQIDRHTRAPTQPRLEREASLQGPSVRSDLHQPHHQPFEPGLTTKDVRRDAEVTGALAELRLHGGAKAGGCRVLTHAPEPLEWPVRQRAVLGQNAPSRLRAARPVRQDRWPAPAQSPRERHWGRYRSRRRRRWCAPGT